MADALEGFWGDGGLADRFSALLADAWDEGRNVGRFDADPAYAPNPYRKVRPAPLDADEIAGDADEGLLPRRIVELKDGTTVTVALSTRWVVDGNGETLWSFDGTKAPRSGVEALEKGTCDRCGGSGNVYVCEDGPPCDPDGCSIECPACEGEGAV